MTRTESKTTGPTKPEIHVGVILAALDLSGAKINAEAEQFLRATPDLLAICQRISDNAVPCKMEDGPDMVDGIMWEDIETIRAAIAKARREGV